MRRSSLVRALTLLVGLAPAVLSGCSSSSNGSNGSKPLGTGPVADLGDPVDLVGKPDIVIEVVDNAFVPRVIKVAPGATITFKNTGVNLHDVTPDTEGDFPVLELRPGQSATVTAPSAAQAYRFFCTLHASRGSGLQRGAFVVTG